MSKIKMISWIYSILVGATCLSLLAAETGDDGASLGPGHLKQFGYGRPMHSIDEVQGFPDVTTFFEEYAFKSKPLKMTGAAKLSAAFQKWATDEYFLSMDLPADSIVNVEMKKKEDRKEPTIDMHFQDFVKAYNTTDQYLVHSVPKYLGKDVLLPRPLQCPQVYKEMLVEAIMWFSSGGTKSVLHTDSVENINCLFSGTKELYFIDPVKYGDKVDIDHPEGAYSGVDVDRVDFTKYPGLAEVEYNYVSMEPGDCLYIPFKWPHHVSSESRNIAVNVWWDHYMQNDIDLSQCPKVMDEALTLDKITFVGFDSVPLSAEAVKDHLLDVMGNDNEMDFPKLEDLLTGELPELTETQTEDYGPHIKQMFEALDQNKDGVLMRGEVETATEEAWERVAEGMKEIHAIVDYMLDMEDMAGVEHPNRDEL